MKLYEVHVEAVAYVWAKNHREAETIAQDEIDEVMEGGDFTANEHSPAAAIYADWTDCQPFGEAPEEYANMTVGEIAEQMAEEDAKIDRETLPLFA